MIAPKTFAELLVLFMTDSLKGFIFKRKLTSLNKSIIPHNLAFYFLFTRLNGANHVYIKTKD